MQCWMRLLQHNLDSLKKAACIGCLSVVSFTGCARLRANKEDAIWSRQMSHQALEAIDRNQWDQAEQLLTKAVEACPNDDRVRLQFAQTLWQRGERERAIGEMNQAVSLSGNAPHLLVQLGDMYLQFGDLPQAERAANEAIRRNRSMPEAYALRGHVMLQDGRRDSALASHLHALSLQSDYPEVELAVAEIYQQTDRHQRALAMIQALERRFPPNQVPGRVLVTKGLALKSMRRFDEASQALAEAARFSTSPDLMFHLGEARLLAGDHGNARLTIHRALEISPQHADCQALLARIEADARKTASIRK